MAFGTAKGGNTTGPADVAVDTIASEDFQRIKLVDGTEGSTTAITQPLTDTQLRATAVPVSGPLTDTQIRATALPVSGTVTATGPLTDTQLRAVAVPVSGTVTASGPLTDTQLRAVAVPVSGTVTASGPLTDTQLRAVAVPVSGTVTANLAAGSNNIGDVDVLTLPALVASSANIGDVDVLTLPNVTQARPSTATLTNVNDTNVSTTLLSSTAGRLGASIHNDSTAILYVKFGTTASTTSYTVKLIADAFYEFPQPCFTGRVDGIWSSDASGAARITELTA